MRKITIFVVNNESVNNIKPKLNLCNPGNQIKSQFTENEGIVLKRWEEKFNKPLSKTFDEIVTGGESNVSHNTRNDSRRQYKWISGKH